MRVVLEDGRDAWTQATAERAAKKRASALPSEHARLTPLQVYDEARDRSLAALREAEGLPFDVDGVAELVDWHRSGGRERVYSIWVSRVSTAAMLWSA